MSNWTQKELAVLRDMALSGAKNANIAAALGKDVDEVYNKRSQLGITKDKVEAMDKEPCCACGTPCEVEGDSNNEYILSDGRSGIFCECCKLAVDFVNSVPDAPSDDTDDLEPEDTLADDDGEQTDY